MLNLLLRRIVISLLSVFVLFGWAIAVPFMYLIGWLSREPNDVRETAGEVWGVIRDAVREGHL